MTQDDDTPSRLRCTEPPSDAAAKWLHDNAEAIDAWNAYIEKHGLPLAEYRRY